MESSLKRRKTVNEVKGLSEFMEILSPTNDDKIRNQRIFVFHQVIVN